MQKGQLSGEYRVCEQCSEQFYISPARVRRGKARFCSVACRNLNQTGQERSPVEGRFWSKVNVGAPGECWPWAGNTHKGYGNFKFEGRSQPSSRVAYILSHPEMDRALHVRHTCDNPPCCNPAHLVPGTHQDNMDDLNKRQPFQRVTPKGEDAHAAKVTEQDVLAIRAAREKGATLTELGAAYGVTKQAISLIVKRKNWGWLDGDQ